MGSSAGSKPPAKALCLQRKEAPMARQLTFLEPPPPPGAAPVWETLRAEQREEILAILARLIAHAAMAEKPPPGGRCADE